MIDIIQDIEDKMADAMLNPDYERIKTEYNRLLNIMGNVDGDEVIALVLVSIAHTLEIDLQKEFKYIEKDFNEAYNHMKERALKAEEQLNAKGKKR